MEPAVRPHVAEGGEQIVEPHPGAKLPGRHAGPAVHGKEEGKRAHEVRRDVEQHAALAGRLIDEPEVELLEIADAAVHEPRRTG